MLRHKNRRAARRPSWHRELEHPSMTVARRRGWSDDRPLPAPPAQRARASWLYSDGARRSAAAHGQAAIRISARSSEPNSPSAAVLARLPWTTERVVRHMHGLPEQQSQAPSPCPPPLVEPMP